MNDVEYTIYSEPEIISEHLKEKALEEDSEENDQLLALYVIRKHWEEGYRSFLFSQILDGVKLLKIESALSSLVEKGLVSYRIDEYGDKRYAPIPNKIS